MQIYIAEGTQHTGPFDLDTVRERLRTGRYQPDQLAWYEGAPGWGPIRQLPGLEGISSPPSAANPPPPTAPAPRPYQAPAPYNAPTPYPPSAPISYAPANNIPPRRPWWPVVGGIVVALAILAGVHSLLNRPSRSDQKTAGSPTPAIAAASTPPPAATFTTPATPNRTPSPSAGPAANTRRYVASRGRYSGESAAHFVAFSFDYPSDWEVDENVEDEFVEVRRYVRSSEGENVLTESVSFSYAYSRPGYALATNLPAAGSQLLEMAANSTIGRLPDATKTAPRAGHFGRYPTQEHYITSPATDEDPGLYFRQAIVANPASSGTDGLFVTMLGNASSGVADAESLGKSGGLRTIQESFRFEP